MILVDSLRLKEFLQAEVERQATQLLLRVEWENHVSVDVPT